MHNHLQRIMRLVRKTGDRVIVTDSRHPEESFVLMNFDDYEMIMEDGIDDSEWQADAGAEFEEDDMNEAAGHASTEPAEKWPDERTEMAGENEAVHTGVWHDDIPPEAFTEAPETESAEALDNEVGYGTIRTAEDERPKKRKNWEIPQEIKRDSAAVEEDRYYLENV